MLSNVIVRKATRRDVRTLATRWLIHLSPCWLTIVIPVVLMIVIWSSDLNIHWKVNLSALPLIWIVVMSGAVLVLVGQGLGVISVHTKSHEQWVAVYSNRIIAEVVLNRYDAYSHIENLVVLQRFRRRGVASKMVHQLSEYALRPMYVQATADLMQLYVRLGFVPVAEDDVPKRLKGLFRANRRSQPRKNIKDLVLH